MIHDGDFIDEQLLLTTVQAAKVLGVGRTTIYQLIKHGELRPVHISRSCRISWAELERFVARLDAPDTGNRPNENPPADVKRLWRRTVSNGGQRSVVAVELVESDGDPAA
jgi:excisionase family DNA binding protein